MGSRLGWTYGGMAAISKSRLHGPICRDALVSRSTGGQTRRTSHPRYRERSEGPVEARTRPGSCDLGWMVQPRAALHLLRWDSIHMSVIDRDRRVEGRSRRGSRSARVRRLCANGDRGATGYRWPINDRRSGTAGAPPRPDCSAGIASDLRSCGGCGIRRSACRGRSAGRAARRDGHGRRRDQSETRFTARSGSTPALTSSS